MITLNRVRHHIRYRYSRMAETLQTPMRYIRQRRVDTARQTDRIFISYSPAIKSKLIVDPQMFFSEVYVRGSYEPHVVRYLKKTLRSGMTCIDVGANIGYFTLLIARRVGPSGLVFAFEPTERTFNRLKENIKLNKFENVIPERMALSDHDGEMPFHEGPPGFEVYNSEGEITHHSAVDTPFKIISVASTTLDNYLSTRKISKVDLVKIDAEGGELSVLKGMEETSQANPLLRMIIEFDDQTTRGLGYSAKYLQDWLVQRDWQLSLISPRGNLTPVPGNQNWAAQMVVAYR